MNKLICILFFTSIKSVLSDQKWSDCCWRKTESVLEYKIEKKGTGENLKKDEIVLIHWIWFDSRTGKPLMSSYDNGNKGQEWKVGSGTFVKGFEEGLLKIKRNGEAYLKIPPAIAYGKEGIQGQTTFCYFIKILKN